MPARGPSMQVQCKNHPAVAATGRCARCGEPFCRDCTTDVQGRPHCAPCQAAVAAGQPAAAAPAACGEADEALRWALIGIFCFGFVLQPIAIRKALRARREIAANPRLSGSGKAAAALGVAVVFLIAWLVAVGVRVRMIVG